MNLPNKIKLIPPNEAEFLCRELTKDLPEYFGLPECNEHYAKGIHNKTNFAVENVNASVGLLSLEFPYPKNANIYWMAVFKNYHAQGYGHQLVEAACIHAKQQGAVTITVETLSPSESDENYLKTYNFYKKMGFLPLFNLKPEGYLWNMVYMCKILS